LYFKDLIEIKPHSKYVTLVELYYLSYGLSPFDHKLISKITFKQESEWKKERNLLYMYKPPELRYLFYIYYILPTYKSKSLWAWVCFIVNFTKWRCLVACD